MPEAPKTTTNTNTQSPPAAEPATAVATATQAQTPAAKVGAVTDQLKNPKEALGKMSGKLKMMKRPKIKIPKKLIIVVVVIFVLLVVLMVVVSILGKKKNVSGPAETASPTPTATTTIDVPSQYADDQDVADIKDKMSKLDDALNNTNFREDQLRVPSLDWKVSFNK